MSSQGSEIKMKSGLLETIKNFRANLVGELDIPLGSSKDTSFQGFG